MSGNPTRNTFPWHPWHRWAPWVLLLVGAATFANSIENPFIFDDRLPIERSEDIKRLWPLSAPPESAPAGRPVVILSLAINYAIGGLDPRGYHVFNIGVHVLAAMALFGVIRRTLEGEGLRERFGRAAGPIALTCALVWLVHPMQTEVINYVVQRTSSLMSLCYMLTLYCAIRAVDSPRRIAWYVAAGLACIMGMMCKESMVTAPVLIVLYDVVFLPGRVSSVLRRRLGLYACLATSYVVLAAIMLSAPRTETVGFATIVTPVEYAMNQVIVIAHYLKLVLWPYPLVVDYGPTQRVPFADVVGPGVLIGLLVAASVWALFRWPRLGFLGLAVFIILAPSSSIVPIVPEVGAERRMYLPLAPLVVLLVLLSRELVARWFPRDADDAPQPWAAAFATVLVTATLAVMSVRRNADYHTRVSIWTTAVSAAPGNYRAHQNLGVALLEAGRVEEAHASLEAALRIDTENAEVHTSMGVALSRLGRAEEAMRHFEEAVRLDPEDDEALYNLGTAFLARGRYPEAIGVFRQAVVMNDRHGDTHRNLAVALLLSGEKEEGHRHLEEAGRLMPDSPAPWIAGARALAQHADPSMRDTTRALAYAQKAVDMTASQDPLALAELAMCFAAAGRVDDAVTTMDTAVARAEAAGAMRIAARLRARAEEYRRRR